MNIAVVTDENTRNQYASDSATRIWYYASHVSQIITNRKSTYTNKFSVLRFQWLNSELLSIAFKNISAFCIALGTFLEIFWYLHIALKKMKKSAIGTVKLQIYKDHK